MPKVILTAAQREADRDAYRQREFVRVMLGIKADGISHQSIAADIGAKSFDGVQLEKGQWENVPSDVSAACGRSRSDR